MDRGSPDEEEDEKDGIEEENHSNGSAGRSQTTVGYNSNWFVDCLVYNIIKFLCDLLIGRLIC